MMHRKKVHTVTQYIFFRIRRSINLWFDAGKTRIVGIVCSTEDPEIPSYNEWGWSGSWYFVCILQPEAVKVILSARTPSLSGGPALAPHLLRYIYQLLASLLRPFSRNTIRLELKRRIKSQTGRVKNDFGE